MIGQIKKVGSDIMFHAITHANIHDVIALLNDNEVDVNCTNINGQTPLHYAVQAENSTIIEILLQYKAEPNIADHEDIGGNTAMHLATEKNMIGALQQFMNCGGDPEIKNQCGFSCLHIAAREGHLEICKLLIAKDVNLDLRDNFGYSPAYWAHQKKHAEIVAILPAPLKVTKEDYYEHIKQVWELHGHSGGGKKKKKGKKGGGKKKK